MTDLETGLNGLKVLFCFVGLWSVYRYMFYRSVRDCWRQELYNLRGDLWQGMWKLERLNSPAHVELRSRLNGLIRLADHINLWSMLAMWWSVPSVSYKSIEPTLNELIAGEKEPEVVKLLKLAKMKMTILVADRMFIWTMPGVFLGIPFLTVALVRHMFGRVKQKITRPISFFWAWTFVPLPIQRCIDRIADESESEAAAFDLSEYCDQDEKSMAGAH